VQDDKHNSFTSVDQLFAATYAKIQHHTFWLQGVLILQPTKRTVAYNCLF